MIFLKKHTSLSFVITFALCLTLLLPSAIQFTHLFENHKHISCGDTTTHFHEKELDCSIQNFHLNTFSFQLFEYPDFSKKITFTERINHYVSLYLNQYSSHFYLRGPPHLA